MNRHMTTKSGDADHTSYCVTKDMAVLYRHETLNFVLFLVISTAFFSIRNVDLLTPLSESTRQILGQPPPPFLTGVAVGVYSVTAAILIIARIVNGTVPPRKWLSLFLRTVFYFFFAVANALPANFMGVFIAGLSLFGLEQFHLWSVYLKHQPAEKSLFGKL